MLFERETIVSKKQLIYWHWAKEHSDLHCSQVSNYYPLGHHYIFIINKQVQSLGVVLGALTTDLILC